MDDLIEKILIARENRVEIQNDLICKFNKTILAIRANYPGVNKENKITTGIVNIISYEIKKIFKNKILFVRGISEGEGPISIFVIDDEAMNVKKLCVNVEETHKLGRFVDMDVYRKDGISISRKELGYESRKCFLCNKSAHLCVRQKTHKEEELIDYIESCYNLYNIEKQNI